jgi:hypothetical protein
MSIKKIMIPTRPQTSKTEEFETGRAARLECRSAMSGVKLAMLFAEFEIPRTKLGCR